jgi:hypothetical protein
MDIEVYRGAGDRTGSPIITPLLSDDMLIVRGRAEMNANAHAHAVTEHSGEVIFRPGMRLGQLAESPDITSTSSIRSKITGISISISLSEGAEPKLTMDTHIKLRQSI